jgi:hypothetical protein
MSDMVRRIQKELHDRGEWKTPWRTCSQCEDAARAILGILHEPSLEMIWAGQEVLNLSEEPGKFELLSAAEIVAIWHAMVNIALEQSDKDRA